MATSVEKRKFFLPSVYLTPPQRRLHLEVYDGAGLKETTAGPTR